MPYPTHSYCRRLDRLVLALAFALVGAIAFLVVVVTVCP